MKVEIECVPPDFGEAFLPYVPRGLKLIPSQDGYGGKVLWYGDLVVEGTGFFGRINCHVVARFKFQEVDVIDTGWWSALEPALQRFEKETGREVSVTVRDYP